ncbi:hypothetical protein NHX12_016715, partial [Muraenolepis orangiensis]
THSKILRGLLDLQTFVVDVHLKFPPGFSGAKVRLVDTVHEDSSVEWTCTVVGLRVFLKPVPAPTSCSESKPERMDNIRAVLKEGKQ